jgi:hypothetical protein
MAMSGYEAGKDAAAMARYLGSHTGEGVVNSKLASLALSNAAPSMAPWVNLYDLKDREQLEFEGYSVQWRPAMVYSGWPTWFRLIA